MLSCGSNGLAVHEVALAIGSNMGDSAVILQGAIDDLASVDGISIVAVSPAYETDPVGGPEQDAYLNAVVLAFTELDPWALLAVTQSIEQHWHRERLVRWGPRTLDIDILAIDAETVDSDDLVVPHPRAHERAFVLVPWAEVAADALIPGHGRVGDLREQVDASGVRPSAVVLHYAAAGDEG
jgi:2-amino-4-hydroxy-6-hydroxymethyldihydropteridine diphosphokinase